MTVRPEDMGRPTGRNIPPPSPFPEDREAVSERFGLMAEFDDEEALFHAARAAREAGFTRLDAFSPVPVEGLAELLAPPVSIGRQRDRARLREAIARRDARAVAVWLGGLNLVALLTLGGGIAGAITGYLLQLWSMGLGYPYLNVGGRPINSWPYYIPITYELTILFAAFSALIGMIVLNGLPRPYHPVFNVPEFARASQDKFFLVIQADDPRFGGDVAGESHASARRFLESVAPGRIHEVAA